VSELSVPLESIGPCLQGVLPSWLVTCSAEGVPNATIISIVRYVDSERVALTRQFFNKTRANLDANPQAQVIVVDPGSGDQFALDLRYLHTESEGAIFDEVEANLTAVASQMGMSDVFRLRGVDIHRVLRCDPFGETAVPSEEPGAERDALPLLDEFMRRLASCVDYADAARVGLETLDDLFGFAYSILLTTDERGDRLFAVASNGYVPSGVGAEVPVGVGLVGVAAERRRVVCVPNLARSRAMNAAVQDSIRRSGAEPSVVEIELPGLARVQSAAAVPLLTRGELTGVLYLESERQGEFSPGKERLLRILGAQLAAALAVLEADRDESGPDESEPPTVPEGNRSRSRTTRRTTASSSTTPTWSRAYRAGFCGSCSASTRWTGAPRSPTASCGSTNASGCRWGTTTSRRDCSSCVSASERSSAGSCSTGSTAAGSRSASRRR
jgi:GAF domain-containing protein/pyridoxamine 5'-phosphate oxidase-like protein